MPDDASSSALVTRALEKLLRWGPFLEGSFYNGEHVMFAVGRPFTPADEPTAMRQYDRVDFVLRYDIENHSREESWTRPWLSREQLEPATTRIEIDQLRGPEVRDANGALADAMTIGVGRYEVGIDLAREERSATAIADRRPQITIPDIARIRSSIGQWRVDDFVPLHMFDDPHANQQEQPEEEGV